MDSNRSLGYGLYNLCCAPPTGTVPPARPGIQSRDSPVRTEEARPCPVEARRHVVPVWRPRALVLGDSIDSTGLVTALAGEF